MELGVTTFAETALDANGARVISHGDRLRQVLDEVVLADEVGLDVYGIGEHHRPDFAASAPAVVLAAAAGRTKQIKLSPAVTVLSSDDPVRVFQQFATLDIVSSGRAELLVGRGSFIESFPLFGYSLSDYDELFKEKLDLLLAIRDSERVTWSGQFRSPLDDQGVYPRPDRQLPVWVGVGGTPESVVRAGHRGLPVALAIIGGSPDRFSVFSKLHRRSLTEAGFTPAEVPLAVHAHGHIAPSMDQAVEEFYPSYAAAMTQIGRERGWGPMTREQFHAMSQPDGSLVIGTPEQVAAKILRWRDVLGIDRFMLHVSVGTMDHEHVMRSIRMLGTDVRSIVNAGIRF
ncbi:MAG: LLM class flavin-dependent oxidoreductase [Acidimicrobiia bacterium]|nr:LLM class flavin-dependent oxidoreductase [Acidimicrobiia bacterium]